MRFGDPAVEADKGLALEPEQQPTLIPFGAEAIFYAMIGGVENLFGATMDFSFQFFESGCIPAQDDGCHISTEVLPAGAGGHC